MNNNEIELKYCTDVRCFSIDHRQCPICFGIIHVILPKNVDIKNVDIKLTKCSSVTCFDKRYYCPDCYNGIHVTINNNLTI